MNEVVFGPQETNLSSARIPNGTGDFVIQEETFLANNEGISATGELLITDISIYPNPADRFININFNKNLFDKITIYNMMGMKVAQNRIRGKHFKLNIASYPEGIYYIFYQSLCCGQFTVIHP